jgi:hypothetical protein
MENPFTSLNGLIFMKINHSVGKNGSNLHRDVVLIQFLLNTIHLDTGSTFCLPGILAMDGMCGPRTLSAILAYQTHKSGEWPLFKVDGLVSATNQAGFVGPQSAGFSTLYSLNWDFMMALPRSNFAAMGMFTSLEPLYSTVILPLRKAGVLS